VEHARGLGCLLPMMLITYMWFDGRDLGPNLHIVARAAEEQAEVKLIRAGANRVSRPHYRRSSHGGGVD